MRTKHVLMTMALPLAFAACTSEEFESYDSNVSLAQRTEIGQVDLTFGFGNAQTRWDAGLNEEVSDVLGAALIDVPKTPVNDPEKGKWETHYEIEDYISSNYPYTFNGERWTSEAKLVEGSYLFYAPYAEDHQVRTAIKYAAPVAQKLEVENGKVVEMSAVADMAENFTNPFYFGYKFFDATDDNRNISVELRHIFAYPKFTLKNTTGENVTITRILVQDENGTIPAEGEFSNSAIAKAMNNTKEGWGAPQSGNMKESLETEDLLNTSNTETYKETNLVRADLSEAVTVANNGEITFSIVMPAMRFGTGDMTVYFVTESGKAYTFTNSTSTINLVPGRRYPAEDYQVSGELKTAAGQLLTKTINKNETLVDAPYIVTSTQELIDAINSTPANLTSPLKLTIAGDVDFDATVLKTIAEEMSQPVQLVGSINIIGGADADNALDINQKVIFDDAVIESGYVKFNRADDSNNGAITNKNGLNFKTVTVAEGATLVVEKVSTILGDEINVDNNGVITAGTLGNAKITNNGTLELKAAVENVVNNGTLKLGANGSFDSLDTDNEEVQSQTITVSGDTEYDGDLEGVWTVEKGATLTLTGNSQELPYGSSLKVDGTLKGAALTVKGEMTLNGRTDADITLHGKYVAVPTTTNKTENAVLNLNSGSVVVGDVEGNSSNKEAQIVNIADNSIGFLGTITNTNLKATYTFTGNVTKAADLVIPANVNTLVVDGSIAAAEDLSTPGIAATSVEDLTITGNIQALSYGVKITTDASAEVKVGGDILATSAVEIASATSLEVKGGINAKGVEVKASSVTEATLGDVTLEGSNAKLTLATSNAKIVLNGELVSNQVVDWTGAKSLVLKGNVTMANVSLKVPAIVNVFGNVTIDGTGNAKVENGSAAYTITVGANSKLTIGSGMTVAGVSGQTVTFESNTNGENGQPVANAKTGVVVNNGTVSFAVQAYTKGNPEWWDGKAATM